MADGEARGYAARRPLSTVARVARFRYGSCMSGLLVGALGHTPFWPGVHKTKTPLGGAFWQTGRIRGKITETTVSYTRQSVQVVWLLGA